jgi:glutathione S-transferase
MITFYQLEWCPDCHTVRQVLTELGLTYTTVNVAADREQRPDVMAVSGQSGVPLLEDGTDVYVGAGEIVAHLRDTYPAPTDSAEHAKRGAWRLSRALAAPPRDALARVKELLAGKEFVVVAELPGPAVDPRLPAEYTLLQVSLPAASARAYEVDERAPAAMLLPVSVAPRDGGGSVVAAADPVGQVWLFSSPALRKVQQMVKGRLVEVFAELGAAASPSGRTAD